MVEVEEIELDLGLSIGGSFKNSTTKPGLKPDEFHSDPDLNNGMQQVDPQAKREFQALRRFEAKKKREMKRGTSGDRVGESEPECKRVFKREKTEFFDGVSGGTAMVSWTTPFHAQQPYPYATVQYVPLNNGLGLPCWVTSEKNVGGIDGVNGGDGKVKSNGSSRCSSSVVSDYQSSSREDGGSTDSHSHSAHSFVEPTQMNSSKEINIRSQPEENASSHPMRSKLENNMHLRKHNVKETESQSNVTQPNSIMLEEEQTTKSKAVPMPIEKPLSNENPSNSPLKETKVDMGKAPKPLSQTSSFPQMPYVSTKGNGPNGRTVHGFLYRYTKSEVCIVCVCHGSTFSPAEFVQHAGGTDISHPLRHITVIPSAFG